MNHTQFNMYNNHKWHTETHTKYNLYNNHDLHTIKHVQQSW